MAATTNGRMIDGNHEETETTNPYFFLSSPEDGKIFHFYYHSPLDTWYCKA